MSFQKNKQLVPEESSAPDSESNNNLILIDGNILRCPNCKQRTIIKSVNNHKAEWICTNDTCASVYFNLDGVPALLDRQTISILERNRERNTEFTYDGILSNSVYNWSNIFLDCDRSQFDEDIDVVYHFDAVQGTVPHKIVNGGMVLEIGTGGGIDGRKLAVQNHDVYYYGVDIGDTIYFCNKSKCRKPNQRFIRASALNLPFADNVFDVVYSYGVFHHTPDPGLAFSEAVRVLKPGGTLYTYLYENHEDNKIKKIPLELIEKLHFITRKMSYRKLKIFCYLLSPLILLFCSYPGQILKKISLTRNIGLKFPLHHGTSPESIIGDLLDRFGASINFRYSKKDFTNFFEKARMENIVATKIPDRAGHLGWGTKSGREDNSHA